MIWEQRRAVSTLGISLLLNGRAVVSETETASSCDFSISFTQKICCCVLFLLEFVYTIQYKYNKYQPFYSIGLEGCDNCV